MRAVGDFLTGCARHFVICQVRRVQRSELIIPRAMPREVFKDWSVIGVPTCDAFRVGLDEIARLEAFPRAPRDDM